MLEIAIPLPGGVLHTSPPLAFSRCLRLARRLFAVGAGCALASVGLAQSENQPGTGPDDPNYRLVVGDVIMVIVFQEEDLTASQRIDAGGGIRLPLLERVSVAGKTIRETEEYLEDLYISRKYLRRPAVTVRVTEFAPRTVHVFGAVTIPGAVELPNGKDSLDIVEIISLCGGFAPKARSNSVKLTRKNPDGSTIVRVVNVEAMISPGKEKVPQVMVYPGDIIHVDDRFF